MNHAPDHIEYLSSGSHVGFSEEWYSVNEQEHFWFEWRWRVFSHLLKNSEVPLDADFKVLDIGCGTGLVRDQLETATNWCVDASDLNPEVIKRVPPGRGRTLFYDVLDVHESLVGNYDVVSFFDVIEHVPDPAALIHAARLHLKDDGWLFVTVPAIPGAFSRYDSAVGHLRRYSKSQLINEVERQGFSVITARYWGLSLVPILFTRKLLLHCSRTTTEQIVRTGMRPPNRISHMVLRSLMSVETTLLPTPPFGASLALIAKKCT